MAPQRKWLLVVAGIAVGVVACANGVQTVQESIKHPGQLAFNGFSQSELDCYKCHNGDGVGTKRGADLRTRAAHPDATILAMISDGAKWMPGYKGKISDEEQQQILAWIREAFGPAAAETAAPDVGVEEVE